MVGAVLVDLCNVGGTRLYSRYTHNPARHLPVRSALHVHDHVGLGVQLKVVRIAPADKNA